MAVLKCRHCEGEISSSSRQVQCPHCAALFPFACAKCGCNLRPPFAVYSDERYLSQDDEPLCGEHFLRMCPDCNQWFGADENPGFFRCSACTEQHAQTKDAPWNTDNLTNDEHWQEVEEGGTTVVLVAPPVPSTRNSQMNIPLLMALMNLFSRLMRTNPNDSNHGS